MDLMWETHSATVAEITARINGIRITPLAYKTFLTICTRLEKKGLLTHTRVGRAFRFTAVMSRESFQQLQASVAVARHLKVFGREAIATFVTVVAQHPEQLARLRQLVNEDIELVNQN
jgi:predicted transcriptional regulator